LGREKAPALTQVSPPQAVASESVLAWIAFEKLMPCSRPRSRADRYLRDAAAEIVLSIGGVV
jgi:hypothetical protein